METLEILLVLVLSTVVMLGLAAVGGALLSKLLGD